MPEHAKPEKTRTAILRSAGIGGFFGFLLAAMITLNLWFVPVAMAVFIVTATVEGFIQGYEATRDE